MKPKKVYEATYLDSPASVSKKSRPRRNLKKGITAFIGVLLAFMVFATSMNLTSLVAYADEEGTLSDAFDDYKDRRGDAEGDTIEKAATEVDTNRDSFESVFSRLFSSNYINYAPDPTVAGSAKVNSSLIYGSETPSDNLCDPNVFSYDTPLYHNCDVPNFMAEVLQALFSMIDSTGVKGLEKTQAISSLGSHFGQPKNIPGDGSVPVERDGLSDGYTGLEVFGYNLTLTSYYGEWDNIKVMNNTRILNNFSGFDSIRLAGNALLGAVQGAFNHAGDVAGQFGSTVPVLGHIAGFIVGWWTSGDEAVSSGVHRILDTSDANVILTYGWYRPDYANTAYGLRALSNMELAAMARASLLEYINQSMPDDAVPDQWLLDISAGAEYGLSPWAAEEPISKALCFIRYSDNDTIREYPIGDKGTALDCSAAQLEEAKKEWTEHNKGNFDPSLAYAKDSIALYKGVYYTYTGSAYSCPVDGNWKPVVGCEQDSTRNTVEPKTKEEEVCTTEYIYNGNNPPIVREVCEMKEVPADPDVSGKTPDMAGSGWQKLSSAGWYDSFNGYWIKKSWLNLVGTMTRADGVVFNSSSYGSECTGTYMNNSSSSGGIWCSNGNGQESFNEWWERKTGEVSDFSGNAASYGITDFCTPSGDTNSEVTTEVLRQHKEFIACWGGDAGYESRASWHAAAVADEVDNQTDNNQGWITKLFDMSVSLNLAQNYMSSNPDAFDFNSPWKRYVCTNPDGSDVVLGTWSSSGGATAGTQEGDIGTSILAPVWQLDRANRTVTVNPSCPQTDYRVPVQNGLFGSGYNPDQQVQVGNDTRHIDNYFGTSISFQYFFFLKQLINLQDGLFSLGQHIVSFGNEILTWTYTPILESLGLKTVIVNIIETLRDGVFFSLALLFIAAAGLYMIYQAGVKRAYRETWASIGYLLVTFILGVALMSRPADVITLVDDLPATFEAELVGTILKDSVSGNPICNATSSTPIEDADTSTVGKFVTNLGTNQTNETLREMLCLNWENFVLEPWAYGQWGTSINNLWATSGDAAVAGGDYLKNTNGSLVGDAAVAMGGGNTVKNWGIYQLSIVKAGTATTVQESAYNDYQLKNIYRIVDAQAGPHNGEGTDASYLENWSNVNYWERLQVGLMSIITSGLLTWVLITYSFSKISVTLVATFMLLLLPLVFLIGLFPTKRRYVKEYFFTIASLMIQRVLLLLVLSIMLSLLFAFMKGANSYSSLFLSQVIILIVFIKFRKKIMNFALGGEGGTFGAIKNGGLALERGVNKVGKKVGRLTGVDQMAQGFRAQAGATLQGSVAGMLVGTTKLNTETGDLKRSRGLGGAIAGAKDARSRRQRVFQRQQMRSGLEGLDNIRQDAKAIENKIKQNLQDDDAYQRGLDELTRRMPSFERAKDDYEKELIAWDNLPKETGNGTANDLMGKDEGGVFKIDQNTGEKIYRPIQRTRPALRVNSPAEVSTVRNYGELLNEKDEKLKRRAEIRRRLASQGSGTLEALGDLPDNASEADIEAAIKATLPDSAGHTNISRKKVETLLKEYRKLAKEITAAERKMDRIETEVKHTFSRDVYHSDPYSVKRSVLEALERDPDLRQPKVSEDDGS